MWSWSVYLALEQGGWLDLRPAGNGRVCMNHELRPKVSNWPKNTRLDIGWISPSGRSVPQPLHKPQAQGNDQVMERASRGNMHQYLTACPPARQS